MLDTALDASNAFNLPKNFLNVAIYYYPHFQMEKQKFKQVKQFAWTWTQVFLLPESYLLIIVQVFREKLSQNKSEL